MTRFDNSLQDRIHKNELLESSISRRNAKASSSNTIDYSTKVSKANITDYQSIIANNDAIIAKRQSEIKKLQKIQKATPKGTEAWYAQQEEINNIQNDINDLKEDSIDAANEIAQAYITMFDNIAAKFDITLSDIEHRGNLLDEQINQEELKGHMINESFYNAQSAINDRQKATLQAQLAEQQQALANAISSGSVSVGSEDWKEMVDTIYETEEGISECETATIELNNAIRDLQWEKFEMFQDMVSDIASESDFLIDLLSRKDLFDDKGHLTDEGNATMALRVSNRETYSKQAKEYADEIARLDEAYASDPLNTTYLDKRQELIELQRECIQNVKDEEDAIVDLVEEGINKELESLQELIDKHKEALQSQKDLYDYQKNVKNQAKEIAALEKQLNAYSGDTSEETKAKVQQLVVELEDAREDLRETEYDKYISDQEALLDDLYDQYEEVLNSRLDDVSALIQNVINATNANTNTISDTINGLAGENGYSLQSVGKILREGENGDILSAVNNVVSAINTFVSTIPNASGSPQTNTTETNQQTQDNSNSSNNTATSDSSETSAKAEPQVGDIITLKDWVKNYRTGTSLSGTDAKAFSNPNKQFRIKSISEGAEYPYQLQYKDSNGKWKQVNGGNCYIQKHMINGYASGVKNLPKDEVAWTQENFREFIIRKADGALLTPLMKGDSVLNGNASENLWNIANYPEHFINDQIKSSLDSELSRIRSLPIQNQSFDGNVNSNITINLPNVTNYQEFKTALQHDKSFEKIVQSMTISKLNGGSSFGKYKY